MKRFFTFLSLFAFFSCSDDNSIANFSDEKAFMSYSSSTWNIRNTLDSAGYYHNLIVEHAINNVDNQMTLEELFDEVKNTAISMLEIDVPIYFEDVDDLINEFVEEFVEAFDSLPIFLSTNSEFNNFLQEFYYKAFDQVNFNSHEDFIEFVKNEEDYLIDSLSLPSIEKELSLVTTSTIRFSAYFWDTNDDEEDVSVPWLIVAGADAYGAYMGYKIAKDQDGWTRKERWGFVAVWAAVHSLIFGSL
ncbi:MAG: hypothetical protein LAT54_04030 [Cryomorphaceae bacterium]|nr:hypothetical protein [Cryomorphaceae bacterium]